MSRTAIAVAVLLALLSAGIGAAYYAGVGPAPGGSDDRERLTDYPTGTPLGTAAGAAGGSTASAGRRSRSISIGSRSAAGPAAT